MDVERNPYMSRYAWLIGILLLVFGTICYMFSAVSIFAAITLILAFMTHRFTSWMQVWKIPEGSFLGVKIAERELPKVPVNLSAALVLFGGMIGLFSLLTLGVWQMIDFSNTLKDHWPEVTARLQAMGAEYGVGTEALHLSNSFDEFVSEMTGVLKGMAGFILAMFGTVTHIIVDIVGGALIAYALVKNWDSFTNAVRQFFYDITPDAMNPYIKDFMDDAGQSMQKLFEGQLNVAFIMAVIYSFSMWAGGVPQGFLIGAASGFLSFFPFVGVAFGVIAGLAAVVVDFSVAGGPLWPVVSVGVIYFVGGKIEGKWLVPKLVGKKLKMNDGLVLFALIGGAIIAGILGLLAAQTAVTLGRSFFHYGRRAWVEVYKPEVAFALFKARRSSAGGEAALPSTTPADNVPQDDGDDPQPQGA